MCCGLENIPPYHVATLSAGDEVSIANLKLISKFPVSSM